ncbi:energy transducer TonB [Arcobacteraceae bacterium]|nr:energy transducer TonB [Arcobacteraceae bacterium]
MIINKSIHQNILKMNTSNKKTDNNKKGLVNIQYVKIKSVKKVEPNIQTTKKLIKKVQAKKTVKKKTNKIKTLKKNIRKINLPTIEKKPIDLKKFFTIQKQERDNTEIIEKEQKKALNRQDEIKEIQQLPALTQSYIKLYGEQYFEYSETQRRYLKQNLNKIGKITQRYLEYPQVSIRTKQQGTNVVEFYFHPNGDITELKLNNSSYYTALDENTIDTIKIAYQNYPKPLEKVKIIIFVKYLLY